MREFALHDFAWFQFSINNSIILGDWISTIIIKAKRCSALGHKRYTIYDSDKCFHSIFLLLSLSLLLLLLRQTKGSHIGYGQPQTVFSSSHRHTDTLGDRVRGTHKHIRKYAEPFCQRKYSLIYNLNLFIWRNPVVNFLIGIWNFEPHHEFSLTSKGKRGNITRLSCVYPQTDVSFKWRK